LLLCEAHSKPEYKKKQQIPVVYSGLLCASQRSNKYQLYTLVCYVLHREATNTSFILWFANLLLLCEAHSKPEYKTGICCFSVKHIANQSIQLVFVASLWSTNTSFILWFAMCFTEKQQIPVLYSGLLCASQRSNKYQFYTLVCYVLHREATNQSIKLVFVASLWST
jgi:hypothetical protein